jgi:hypothetical protein
MRKQNKIQFCLKLPLTHERLCFFSQLSLEGDGFTKTRVVIELGRQADSYMVSDMEMIDQALCVQDNKYYDKITFTCTVVPFDHESFFQPNKKVKDDRKITFEETFWFDISNFFGVKKVDDDNQETESKGEDNSDSIEHPRTTATARKSAKKPVRKVRKTNKKNAKS